MDNFSNYINDADAYYKQAFQRNIGLVSEKEQEKLRNSTVAIVGAGGVGGFHLINLVRLGVGKFHIADGDSYEIVNIQRQCGAFMDTLGKNKAATMKQIALSINPHVEITVFNEDVSAKNVDQFFSGADVFIDGIDFFSVDARRLIFRAARQKGIYAITAGPLGFGSALLIFSPRGMSFDKYFDLNDNMDYLQKIIAFGVGLAPAALHMNYINLDSVNLHSQKGPSLVSACNLCSSMAVTETISLILERKKVKPAPFYVQFDPYLHQLKKGYLIGANRNPLQRIKRWYLFKKFSPKEK